MGNRLKKALIVIAILISFFSGWIGNSTYTTYTGFSVIDMQKPLDAFNSGKERSAPYDRVKNSNIRIFDDKIVVYINNPYLVKFTDTHSMEPLINKKSTGLEIVPKSSSEIKIGDVISYAPKEGDEVIVHRVVKIDYDAQGWYAITKGDNAPYSDPEKVRFGQVKRILVGVLY